MIDDDWFEEQEKENVVNCFFAEKYGCEELAEYLLRKYPSKEKIKYVCETHMLLHIIFHPNDIAERINKE